MDNLGVAMNDTTLNAYAAAKGINKTTQEMTNQEKIGLAMEMFMESFGGGSNVFEGTGLENVEKAFKGFDKDDIGKAYARMPYVITVD